MDNKQKQELFQRIVDIDFFVQLEQKDLFLAFINSFIDLKSMPSTDGRPQFKNAEDDIRQHYIMNDDMPLDEVFSSKVGLYKDESVFNGFLLSVVDSKFTEDPGYTDQLVNLINSYLHQDNNELYLFGYGSNSRPVYKIKPVDQEYSPRDVPVNRIPFFVDKHPTGNSSYATNHVRPERFPCFVLAFNRGWNDFEICTWFDVFYYNEVGDSSHVGVIKIIHAQYIPREQRESLYYYMSDHIDDSFEQLSSDYCSLGQKDDFYFRLKRLRPDDWKSVLWALRDCAIYPIIEEKFSNHPFFFSLIRDREAEETLNDIMYKLNDENSATRFCFNYHFKPKYADSQSDICFRYSSKGEFPNNLYAIIGRNGVGKTQLISQLPLDLEANRTEAFDHKPSFKKYITVSYCYYDNFEIPDVSATFDYRYCGLLKKMPDGKKEIMTKDDLQGRLINDCQEISKKDRVDEWERVMSSFFSKDVIEEWVVIEDKKRKLNTKAIVASAAKLSSGESSFLYVFFDIMAHIRKYSLILFDEPETHLHPTAIASLINAVHRLLKTYSSYGLIVTHSPIIIRELLSRNVLVMRRTGNQLATHKIGIESFGENLSVLTNEIFGSEEVKPYFKNHIAELKDEGYEYEDIVRMIQSGDIPLGLNLLMYVKNLMEG